MEITKSTDYKIKVRDNEDVVDAIIRFMKRNGFETEMWTDGKGLKHRYFYKHGECQECWIAGTSYSDITKKVTFQIDGNNI